MLYTQLIDDGGPIMWVILAGSLIAVFVFLKKVFQFHREEINVRELLRSLDVNGYRPAAGGQCVQCRPAPLSGVDHLGESVGGLGQHRQFGSWFIAHQRSSRVVSGMMPSGSGGSPAVMHNSACQAARCAVMSRSSSQAGVQDARISTSARSGSPCYA